MKQNLKSVKRLGKRKRLVNVDLLKPMLPTLALDIPIGNQWLYEVKFDGYRAIIYINGENIKIVSRNLNILNEQFPEIVHFFRKSKLNKAILDGELSVLESPLKANFEKIQKRGRLKSTIKIKEATSSLPVTFLAFDLLMKDEQWLLTSPFIKRKQALSDLFKNLDKEQNQVLEVQSFEDANSLWTNVKKADGEGIVSKQKESIWQQGVRSKQWQKIKNMKIGTFFVLGYDETNSFFLLGTLDKNKIKMIGKVGQGFTKEEKEALIATIKKNSDKKQNNIIYVNPSICIEVEFLEVGKNELRHPKFRRFRFDKHWEDCSWQAMQKINLN